ncbi:hypothetical protein V6N13_015583 [Hibiscus sabdariffa]
MHIFSFGADLSVAVCVVERTAEVDLRAGSIVTTRGRENSRFYDSRSITASDILLGSMSRPPTAAILYHALSDLYNTLS